MEGKHQLSNPSQDRYILYTTWIQAEREAQGLRDQIRQLTEPYVAEFGYGATAQRTPLTKSAYKAISELMEAKEQAERNASDAWRRMMKAIAE